MSALTLEPILKGRRSQPHMLIETLLDVQESNGYVSTEDMKIISLELGVPEIEVYRAANFYKALSLKPRGKNVITICAGTACHVRGSNLLASQIHGLLGIGPGETTADGQFTLEQVNCLGACALGPVVVLNGEYHDHVTPAKLKALILKAGGQEKQAPGKKRAPVKSSARKEAAACANGKKRHSSGKALKS